MFKVTKCPSGGFKVTENGKPLVQIWGASSPKGIDGKPSADQIRRRLIADKIAKLLNESA